MEANVFLPFKLCLAHYIGGDSLGEELKSLNSPKIGGSKLGYFHAPQSPLREPEWSGRNTTRRPPEQKWNCSGKG